MLRALAAGMRDLEGGQWTKAVAIGGAEWGFPFFGMNECDKEIYPLFSLGIKSLLLILPYDALGLCLFVEGR